MNLKSTFSSFALLLALVIASGCATIIRSRDFASYAVGRSFCYIGSENEYLYFEARKPFSGSKIIKIHRDDFWSLKPDLPFIEYPMYENNVSVLNIFSPEHELFDEFYLRNSATSATSTPSPTVSAEFPTPRPTPTSPTAK